LSEDWKAQKERSTPLLLSLLVWIALNLGRGFARSLLWPISLYFYVFAGAARRGSHRFLRQVGAPRQGWLGVLRHFHTFAACALDRVFLLSGRYSGIRVSVHDPDGILPQVDPVGGALVPTAHLGSFEALRVIGADRKGLRFRIVMDRTHGSMVTSILDGLNPGLAREVIDGGSGGPTLALALQEALQRGHLVGLMADRITARDRGVPVSFLGAPARLPDSLWRLAAVLGAPVVLCFGLYRGGTHYELYFERFLEGGARVPRQQRTAFVQDCAERYARRLEHYVRSAPYNWFNFYDFWSDESPGDH
jgi:predicted LPLAT superfamily acyltransferase